VTAPTVERKRIDLNPDDLHHEVCCDEDTAVCGEDVTGHAWLARGINADCPLCVVTTHCFICGRSTRW
jgi:hypothetical protein